MNSRNKKYGFKRFLVGGMMALCVFSTSFLTANLNRSLSFDTPIYADTNYKELQSLISNNYFNSYSTSTTPYSPTNWTSQNPNNNESIKMGVIDVNALTEETKKSIELSESPGVPSGDNITAVSKHLMINSFAGFGRAGYTSSVFNLEANSYYAINVTLKTQNQALASIYVTGLKNNETANITRISTLDSWQTYTIFIETKEFDSESVSVELWLGDNESLTSQGAVFFNRVELTRFNKVSFEKEIRNSDERYTTVARLQSPVFVDANDFIDNPDFSEQSNLGNIVPGWELIDSAHSENQILKVISTTHYIAEVDTDANIANPKTNARTEDSNVLFMYNKVASKQGIKSKEFVVKQNELYKLTVWAKSDCGTGSGATIKLVEVNPDEEDEDFTPNTASVKTNTTITTNSTLNNWSRYNIFIEGHPLKDTKATLQILLGDETETDGYVFIDNITLEKVNHTTYSAGNVSGNSATYTFNKNNTQFMVTNGNFNVGQKQETTLTYPLKPSNWTHKIDENFDESQIFSGIINTNDAQFANALTQYNNKNLGGTFRNPGLTPIQKIAGATTENSSNNVLMIGNTSQTSQSYTSDTISLTANSYYKLSLLVNTQTVPTPSILNNNGVQIRLYNSSYDVFNIRNLDTFGEWETITIYIYTNATLNDFNLELALNNIQGFAFFDDVMIESSNEIEFNNVVVTSKTFKAKLDVSSRDSFDLVESNSDSAMKQVYNWTATNHSSTDNIVYGALDTSKNISTVFAGINNPGAVDGNNVLAIYSNNLAHFTLSASNKIDLAIDTFYKITVNVRTYNIYQDEEERKYDKDGKLIPYGATIALHGYEKYFKAIDTERDDIDGWATYTFYINPEADTNTYVILGLGDENNYVSGYVFFDDIKVTTIDEAAYKEATATENPRVITLTQQKIDTDETDTGNDFKGQEFDWYLVPSILTALAIIIAVVGSTVRKFKFTQKPKIKTNYDRRKTLEVDLSKRERIELRNEIIKELNNEYKEIDNEIKELERQLEQEIAEYKRRHEEKLKAYEEIKQSIIIEREQATREYNNKLNSTENLTNELKAKYEKEFKQYLAKLDKRANEEAKKISKQDRTLQILEEKHNAKVKQLTERQKYILEEIERIEREIEEIAKQEEIMWNEYRKAKEEAKKQKLEYLANKRKEKELAKQNKRSSTKNEETSSENKNTSETESTSENKENK